MMVTTRGEEASSYSVTGAHDSYTVLTIMLFNILFLLALDFKGQTCVGLHKWYTPAKIL